jgi:hypothetical protein
MTTAAAVVSLRHLMQKMQKMHESFLQINRMKRITSCELQAHKM